MENIVLQIPPFQAATFPIPATSESNPPAKPKKVKRGKRRVAVSEERGYPVVISAQQERDLKRTVEPRAPAPVRKRKRVPRRSNSVKRPRTSPVRRPKRASAIDTTDLERIAMIFSGCADDDGPLLADLAAALQNHPAPQRQRVLAILQRMFAP